MHLFPPLIYRHLSLSLALAFIVLVADQAAKLAIRGSFALHESREIIASFFNLTYVRNTGAVWGLLQNQNEWLVVISLVVIFLLAFSFRYIADGQVLNSIAVGCILGGILGNLVDRVKFGWVIDFLDFYVGEAHWPSFNIADTFIVVGVGLYLVASLKPAAHK